jgi:hypothetical protein
MKHLFLAFFLLSVGFQSFGQLSSEQNFDDNQVDSLITESIVPPVEDFEFNSDVFQNVSAIGLEGGATITWSLDYELLNHFQGGHLIIKYNTAIGEKRDKAGMSGNEWTYTEPIPINSVNYTIEDLFESEKYSFKLGLAKGGDIANLDHSFLGARRSSRTFHFWNENHE